MVDLVIGTRPDIIKLFPLYKVLCERRIQTRVVHTGQHYDELMSDVFLQQFNMPVDVRLRPNSTGDMYSEYSNVLRDRKPRASIVLGDVSGALFCALAASHFGVPVIHIEAGLRSFDKNMPEEVNRILIDQVSSLLITHSPECLTNLVHEGVDPAKIRFCGNTLIDAVSSTMFNTDIIYKLKLKIKEYVLVTIHRQSNVDNAEVIYRIFEALHAVSKKIKVVLVVHHRLKKMLSDINRGSMLFIDPVGYSDFLSLQNYAKVIISDSGGVQEESAVFRVPCLVIRTTTERPVTCYRGASVVVGTNPDNIISEYDRVSSARFEGLMPDFWDGNASYRIANEISSFLDYK